MEFILKSYPLFIWNSDLTGRLVFLFAKFGSPNWSDQPTPWRLGRWHSVQINLVGKDGGLFCTCKFYGSEQGLWWGTMDHAVWPRAGCVTSLCPSCHSWKTDSNLCLKYLNRFYWGFICRMFAKVLQRVLGFLFFEGMSYHAFMSPWH